MVTARYLAVGVACALLYNAIVIAGDRIGLHYAWSLLISFAIVVVLGYRLHTGWTFPGAAREASFVRYTFMASFNYPLMVAGLFVFVDLLSVPVPVAMPIVTVLLAAVNFFGSRWALRARRSRARQTSASPARVTTIASTRCPEWLPRDDEIVQRLGAHQSLYRFREPRYQVQLLKDPRSLSPGDCRVLDIGAGSGLVA
jgi:putative flippase GtrA